MARVSNLLSPKTNRAIVNQYVLFYPECFGFRSYNTLIAYCDGNGQWFINQDFANGSASVHTHTTTRNFNYFLQRYQIAKDWQEFCKRPDLYYFDDESDLPF